MASLSAQLRCFQPGGIGFEKVERKMVSGGEKAVSYCADSALPEAVDAASFTVSIIRYNGLIHMMILRKRRT